MATLTPMMQQYKLLKEQHRDAILFFRLGDFYEMFFEDAVTASQELELTLTGRDCGLAERAPMCGVPFHSVETYINRLLDKGYKVAICEQLSDPAESQGLVERDVIRIITPGTVIESSILDDNRNSYLVSLCFDGLPTVGLAVTDVSTGEFSVTEATGADWLSVLQDELTRLAPREIIADSAARTLFTRYEHIAKSVSCPPTPYDDAHFDSAAATACMAEHFGSDADGLWGCADMPCGLCAAGALIAYLNETQKNALGHINRVNPYRPEQYMMLDASTRRNLELTETLRGQGRKGSLLWMLDQTRTSMGARMLKKWIEQPLQSPAAIDARLDAVEALKNNLMVKEAIRESLGQVRDIERIAARITYGAVNARDCLALMQSLEAVPRIREQLATLRPALLQSLREQADPMDDVRKLLGEAIADNPPAGIKEGGIIRDGYNEELDRLRSAFRNGRELIAQMESAERKATGIKNLRIGFNKVFGYYIDVTKSNLDLVPYRYTRKQTLANSERYVTAELKELEDTILGAEERSIKIEYQLFLDIRDALASQIPRMQATAEALAALDVLQSLATVAIAQGYCRPAITQDGEIIIEEGRHPVVERALTDRRFVPNSTHLNMNRDRFLIITGPNMSGKSTYLRQVALITLMAHIGSFVPAHRASISITDRIFTRVGATDDLFMGQSTFMVEMSEVANILRSATSKSLLILDEIGRGTSTFDGLSIAWAVVEYLCDRDIIGAKTLFATHYHELSELEGSVAGVRNYSVAVLEQGEDITFLHRIVQGSADRSFGIHVARLAGLPDAVVRRAGEILRRLEKADINKAAVTNSAMEASEALNRSEEIEREQLDWSVMLPYSDLLQEIRRMDLTTTTPIDAFYTLKRLKDKMEQKS
jgi:DNA mismatch repair protein MutS